MRYFEVLNIEHFVTYLFPALVFIVIFAAGLGYVYARRKGSEIAQPASSRATRAASKGRERAVSARGEPDHRGDCRLVLALHHLNRRVGGQNLKMHPEHQTSAFKTWSLVLAMVGIVVFRSTLLAYTVIGDLGETELGLPPMQMSPASRLCHVPAGAPSPACARSAGRGSLSAEDSGFQGAE